MFFAAASASATVNATSPRGTGTLYLASIVLAWYSCIFIWSCLLLCLELRGETESARTAKPNFIMPSATILDLLHAVAAGRALSEQEAEQAMQALLWGESTPVLTSAFLTALRVRGETVEELAGFARAMRAAATKVDIGPECRPLIGTCGTGGDGLSTFNISTVAAFVIAGAGVRVAKHGNRSISSRCGSADVLEALGVRTAIEPEMVA